MTNHKETCECTSCLMADMDRHLTSVGMSPAAYPWGHVQAEPQRRSGNGNGSAATAVRRNPRNLITDRQLELLQRLVREDTKDFQLLGDDSREWLQNLNSLDRQRASDLISAVLALPSKQKLEAKSQTGSHITVGEGFYLHLNQVVRAKASNGTGRLYATVLDPETGRSEYARGRVFQLRPEMKLTLEQAAKLGAKWHRCAICGTELTDPDSVERGIGPYCAKKL